MSRVERIPRPRVLLLFPSQSYRVEGFVAAAERAGVDLVLGTDVPAIFQRLGLPVFGAAFGAPDRATASALEALRELGPIGGVVATNEATAVVASLVAEALGLSFSSPDGARAARDKIAMRDRLAARDVPSPRHLVLEPGEDAASLVDRLRFPCVVKPPRLSGSQGVIRADDPAGLARAVHRTRAILDRHPSDARHDPAFFRVVIEDYLPGVEVAVEALMTRGRLEPIAIFDKPDELAGPFFEETIYVTPSRLSTAAKAAILDVTARAALALGLDHGPIHAELRVDGDSPSIVEIAARSIGGLCSRVFSFCASPLEDVLLAHAAGLDRPHRAGAKAAGVMMMPIAKSGVLRSVSGLDRARAVEGVESVELAIRPGEAIRALPEGSSYLGFVFAHGDRPEQVERALREAFAEVRFEWTPLLEIHSV